MLAKKYGRVLQIVAFAVVIFSIIPFFIQNRTAGLVADVFSMPQLGGVIRVFAIGMLFVQ